MKNILKVNGFFYILFFITILTGHFKIFIEITIITFIHELGHILTGIIFKYNIEKIVVLPFGMYTIFNKKINESFIKDFIVTISGPLNQILLLFILKDNKLNLFLLFFNLLPIIPLDGAKLLNLFLELFLPFKSAYLLSFYISISLLTIFIRPNLTFLIIIFLYLFKNIKFYQNNAFYFNKFLFERYLYGIKYIRARTIFGYNLKYIKKFYTNDFIINKKIIKESIILESLFDNSRVL